MSSDLVVGLKVFIKVVGWIIASNLGGIRRTMKKSRIGRQMGNWDAKFQGPNTKRKIKISP